MKTKHTLKQQWQQSLQSVVMERISVLCYFTWWYYWWCWLIGCIEYVYTCGTEQGCTSLKVMLNLSGIEVCWSNSQQPRHTITAGKLGDAVWEWRLKWLVWAVVQGSQTPPKGIQNQPITVSQNTRQTTDLRCILCSRPVCSLWAPL